VRGNWAFNVLKKDQKYQILISYQQPFYNLIKISEKKAEINKNAFELGRAELKEYILAKYSKFGSLESIDFLRLHQKIDPKYYNLNLKGLIPKNNLIKESIDLAKIHKPKNNTEYSQGYQEWIALQAFLKLALLKKMDLKKGQDFGFKTKYNQDFLKEIVASLEFQMSDSQKLAVWDILQELI